MNSPLVARLILTIGVTGHRASRLADVDMAALAAAVDETLGKIALAAVLPGFPVQLRLVTALADGADAIVAECAVARGWQLASVLPFAREAYQADFAAPESLAAYQRLLAASHAVFELPGVHHDDESPGAYERAGRIVLAQSDIVLALWDGRPAQGRGGTAQIVGEAVAQDIPVIQIDPRGGRGAVLLWDGLTEHDLGQQSVATVPRGSLDALPGLIGKLLLPPGDRISREQIAQLAKPRPPRAMVAIVYPLLLAITGVQRLAPRHFRPADGKAAGALFRECFIPVAPRTGIFGANLETVLLPRFVQADTISNETAQLFRSSYVSNFILSAIAVLLTLLSLALPISAKPLLLFLELLTIATVLALTTAGNRRGWHGRWLDNRILAESLRCLALSAQIGRLHRAGGGQRSDIPDWVRYYLRLTAQELGLPDAVADRAYLGEVRAGLGNLIDSQIAYLAGEAQRMHRLDHRLHRLGTALFASTALACIVALAFEAGLTLLHRELSAAAMHVFLVSITTVTAGLPALGAAIYGIRMQGEFATVGERARTLLLQLGALRHTIDTDELSFDLLQRRIEHLTALLTTDIATWRRTYHARPLALPG